VFLTSVIAEWAKSPKKQSDSALKIQCHIVKNTLPQTAFSAILGGIINNLLHVNIGDSIIWTSLSTCVKNSAFTSKLPLKW